MAASNNHGFSWHHTMLRIKDPKATLPFYTEHFGFSLIHQYHFAQWNFSLYFLAILPEGTTFPEPGTKEAEQFLWTFKGTCLELTHNHGAENDADFKVSSGNTEPNRGFGHLAVMTPDVYAVSAELEAKGVAFQKRPDEGRMKGLAFALDPDGYWIEIVKRNEQAQIANKYTLAQTMFRIKDPVKSLHFYRDLLGMTLLRESHHGDFSLYFLAHLSPEEAGQADSENFVSRRFGPVIELTHNHGTENDADFRYYNGNDQDLEGQVRGFGHTAFLADDLDAACAYLESEGVSFKKKPMDGNMRGIAFVYDPDNYWVEVIQRGGVSML